MVNGEVVAADAAVLAGVMVADKDLAAGELHAWPGATDEVGQPDDGGGGIDVAGRGDADEALFKNLGLPTEDEQEGPSNIADVERLIVLIEHQYGVIHPADPLGSGLPRFAFAP